MGRGLGRGLALGCLCVAACLVAPVKPAWTAGTATVTAPATASAGQTIIVSWQGIATPTTTDWIGLYRQGVADTAFSFWFFTATCTSTSGPARAAGSCSVKMPTTTGTYEFRLFANNVYTRLATSSPVTVGSSPPADTTPPTVSLTTPTAGATVSGAVQLAASASDNAGVARVDFLANGSVVATDTSAPYGAAWDSTALPNGQVQLAARAADAAGNTATSTAWAVTVQNVPTDPVLLAAGDIASCSSQGDEATASILGLYPNASVVTLGDNAYDTGTVAQFQNCYGPTWGAYRSRTHPSVGNHDYDTTGASGYFGYFGSAAGPADRGWYSYDLGTWHIVVLNSNCWAVGGCGVGSAQEFWLQTDLAAHPAPCTLAYWHHPRFTSGWVGNDAEMAPIWSDLHARNAAVVLNGHAHMYERFAPQSSVGIADPSGPREFVVGTGGEDTMGLGSSIAPNSVAMNSATLGVLKLTLHSGSYDWQFLPVAGAQYTDTGSAACPAASDTTPPAISGVSAGSITTSGATINWTTNEAADTQVEYGTTTAYGSATTVNTTLVTGHSQALTGLAAATLYHYRVKSRDAAGNLATSSDFTFTTATVTPPSSGPNDAFTTAGVDPAKWTITASSSTVSVVGGMLQISHPAGGWTNGSIESAFRYDQTGKSVQVQLVRAANLGRGGSTYGETTIRLRLDATHYADFFAGGGSLTAWVNRGTGDTNLTPSWPAYNPTTMQWLRFRESAGRLYWEYASGTITPGTWTALTSTTNPFAVTSLTLMLKAGSNLTTTDAAQFDNVSTF